MGTVTLPDAEIAYDVAGAGAPVVFLQGVGLAGRAWQPQVDALSASYRCITFDNRGIGASHGETSALAQLQSAFGRSLAESPAVTDLQLCALREHDQRNQLARLGHIPTLVLSGKLDPIARHAGNVALARLVGTARHQVWRNASHALPIQLPGAVNEALAMHLRNQASKKSSAENRRVG